MYLGFLKKVTKLVYKIIFILKLVIKKIKLNMPKTHNFWGGCSINHLPGRTTLNSETKGLFGLCFFRTIFKNIENTILVFSENYSSFLNLFFFVFFGFFRTKQYKELKTCSSCFPCFSEQK